MWPDERRKNAHRCGAKHVSKSKCTKHTMPGALLEVAMSKKCTPFWREHISKSKCTKHTMLGPLLEVKMMKKCTPLWREDARSTFPNQNAQNTPCPEHFWKLWCRKSARRCGAKHIWKSKALKTEGFGPLLEAEMFKIVARKCAKNISKSKCTQHHLFAPLLDVETSFCVAGARDSAPCQK